MELSPYLNFNGECAAAFTFYQQCLGGDLQMHTHGDSPTSDGVPPEWRDKIMHARLAVGSGALMGSDAPPAHYAAPQGMHVSINVASPAEGERLFNALAAGGSVTMPFQKTFWSPGFGMLVDQFAIPWMVNCEQAA